MENNKLSDDNAGIKASSWALMPMLVFILTFLGFTIAIYNVSFLNEAFGSIPVVPSLVIALAVALLQNKKRSFIDKLSTIGTGIGNSSIIYMIIIFIFAGAFAGAVGRSSASSVAYFMLNIIPSQFSVLVIFIVSCLVSLAMGTSVGSITLMMPIAIHLSAVSGQSLPLCAACVLGGSMFGDNLSMISDTSIASCMGLECKPKEKFLENLHVAIPAAIITIGLIIVLTINAGNGIQIKESYNIIEFIPYILVLIMSICGVNVLIVLSVGIISGLVIDFTISGMDFLSIFNSMKAGVAGMYEIIVITVLVAAISALIQRNGGFLAVLNFIKKHCKTSKIAQLSAGIVTALIDVITANNTVAIVVAAPLAKEIANTYIISKRRMASTLDTFSCVAQGLLPYGAQMMILIMLCNEGGFDINAFDVIPMCFYQFILFAIVVVYIMLNINKKKTI